MPPSLRAFLAPKQCTSSAPVQRLFHEFRFHDPSVEEDFRRWMHPWCVRSMRCHALLVLALAILAMLTYIGAPLPTSFWLLLFPASVSLMLLLLLHVQNSMEPLQQVIVPIFSCLCACVTLWLAYMLWQWPQEWLDRALRVTLADVVASPLTPEAQSQLRWFVMATQLPTATAICMMMNLTQLTFLFVISFSWWTCLAAWVMVPSFIAALAISPVGFAHVLAEAFVRMVLLCGGCTALAAQMSLTLRSNFLAELLIAQQLRTSEMADSVLNHGLKNTMADAASNLELFLNGELPINVLHDSLASLRRGMRSCKERQLYLKLVAGEYSPSLQPTNLEDFGQQLIAGRRVVGHFSPRTVLLDPMLCSLIFDNAIHNAFCHGDPDDPAVHFTISEDETPARCGFVVDRVQLTFTVTNRVNPNRPPLTEEFVSRMMAGHPPPLRQSEAPGPRPLPSRPGSPPPLPPPLSDRIGLSHCFLAAQQHGMRLSLTQEGNIVRFVVTHEDAVLLPPARMDSISHPALSPQEAGQFPSGLRYQCLDDSLASRHLLKFHISKFLQPGSVLCMGESEKDVEVFVELALEEADVVILDQHLEYTHSYLGIDLLRQLRDSGFAGLMCVRSANNSPLDVALYHRSGAHCVFGKDVPGAAMAEQIKAVWVHLSRQGLVHARSLESNNRRHSFAGSTTSPLAFQPLTSSG